MKTFACETRATVTLAAATRMLRSGDPRKKGSDRDEKALRPTVAIPHCNQSFLRHQVGRMGRSMLHGVRSPPAAAEGLVQGHRLLCSARRVCDQSLPRGVVAALGIEHLEIAVAAPPRSAAAKVCKPGWSLRPGSPGAARPAIQGGGQRQSIGDFTKNRTEMVFSYCASVIFSLTCAGIQAPPISAPAMEDRQRDQRLEKPRCPCRT